MKETPPPPFHFHSNSTIKLLVLCRQRYPTISKPLAPSPNMQSKVHRWVFNWLFQESRHGYLTMEPPRNPRRLFDSLNCNSWETDSTNFPKTFLALLQATPNVTFNISLFTLPIITIRTLLSRVSSWDSNKSLSDIYSPMAISSNNSNISA